MAYVLLIHHLENHKENIFLSVQLFKSQEKAIEAIIKEIDPYDDGSKFSEDTMRKAIAKSGNYIYQDRLMFTVEFHVIQ